MEKRIPNSFWFLAIGILLLPALLINLGLLAISEDEAIRALVTLEMKLSGNLITPTLNGDYYYAKPPLYNWILLIFYAFSTVINEWTLRIPTIIFLLSFAGSIYYYSAKHFDRKFALTNALVFVTCGRVLFWDSMLGYIDMLYSWITFVQIMVIYHSFKKGRITQMFVLSYLLTATGFMLKAFPSLLFQAITLVTVLWYYKKLKMLFTKEHLYGILILLGIVGFYYFIYYQYNDLSAVFESLLDQSTRRTVVHEKNEISEFFLHLISYPFENLYHFFPWAILIVYAFSRRSREMIKGNDFLVFSSLAFMANIIVYWSSPEVYPRYILMLMPFFFTVVLAMHEEHGNRRTNYYKAFQLFFTILILCGGIGSFALAFLEPFKAFANAYLKAFIPGSVLLLLAFYLYRRQDESVLILITALLVLRIVFDIFILPERLRLDYATNCREQALSIGERYKNSDLRIYKKTKIDWTSSFYISKTRKKITYHDHGPLDANAYYVLDTIKYDVPAACTHIESFNVREHKRTLFILKCDNGVSD